MNNGIYSIHNICNIRVHGCTYAVFKDEDTAAQWEWLFETIKLPGYHCLYGYMNAFWIVDDWQKEWKTEEQLYEVFNKNVFLEWPGGGQLYDGNTEHNRHIVVSDMNDYLEACGFPGRPMRDVHFVEQEEIETWQWLLIVPEEQYANH